ncbi:methyl-accepting chemotaxis protein [Anaerobacillus sp. MEB173]|uniref:methyl-accepting chemotaxis protein n=1 Tax=Anaerobacillus sp. MEB173 TaxID=3383345 RepID=UPI003F91EEC4
MKLAAKLIFSFMLIVLILISLSFYAISSLSSINENGVSMYDERLVPISNIGNLSRLAENTRVQMLEAGKSLDSTFTDRAEQNITEINQIIEEYDQASMSHTERELFESFKGNWSDYITIVRNNISLVHEGNVEELQKGVQAAQTPFREASINLGDLLEMNKQSAESLLVKNQNVFEKTRLLLIVAVGIGIVLAITIGLVISRIIVTPVNAIKEQANRVAEGDLTISEMPVKSKDELGELTVSFNKMIKGLQSIVHTVRTSTDDLAAASQEMAASSQEVTAGIDEMATNTQQVAEEAEVGNLKTVETSKVLLELSSLIQIAKEKATSATNNSKTTLDAAVKGKSTVEETIARMGIIRAKTIETEQLISTLDDYSKEIGIITETITGIAKQTNLLALNAAIEAARAGESGKGFAVVADEVRKLAEQSNQGAGKVADLARKVTTSTAEAVEATQFSRLEVEQGVTIVRKSGDALESILTAVKMTVEDISQIEEITDSEVASSEQIVGLIHSLATIIENTAASVEEVSASTEEASASMETISSCAEETSAMSNELKSVVERFKLS